LDSNGYFMNEHCMAWPHIELVAYHAGIAPRNVLQHLKKLISQGWIKKAGMVGRSRVYNLRPAYIRVKELDDNSTPPERDPCTRCGGSGKAFRRKIKIGRG